MQHLSEPIDRVVVIGGGLAGLAAAEELLRGGGHREVTIVEASDRPGGVVASVRYDGWLTER